MDGLTGLEKVFNPDKIGTNAKVLRCQVHVVRNALAKMPKKLKDVKVQQRNKNLKDKGGK